MEMTPLERIFWLALPVVVIGLALVSQRSTWSAWRGSLALHDPDVSRLVRAFERRSRWLRFTPVAVALGGPILWFAATNTPPPRWMEGSHVPMLAIGGYTLGVLASGIALPRPAPADLRSARLTPRLVADHVDRRILVALWALPLAALVLVPFYVIMPAREAKEMSDAAMAGLAIGTLLVPGAAFLVMRGVVRRPQPVMSPGLVQADDAIRSAMVRAVSAASTALLLFVNSWMLWQFAFTSDLAVLRHVAGVAAVASSIAAWVVWVNFGRPVHAPASQGSNPAP
jgi:hypothetical protein